MLIKHNSRFLPVMCSKYNVLGLARMQNPTLWRVFSWRASNEIKRFARLLIRRNNIALSPEQSRFKLTSKVRCKNASTKEEISWVGKRRTRGGGGAHELWRKEMAKDLMCWLLLSDLYRYSRLITFKTVSHAPPFPLWYGKLGWNGVLQSITTASMRAPKEQQWRNRIHA